MFELHNFEFLKVYIEKELGIDTSKSKSNFTPIREIFRTKRELDASVAINDDGIFYTDEKGKKHKGFLFIAGGYKVETALARGWNTIVPKFHIVNCATILQQKARSNFNGHYVFSQKVELVEDIDGVEKEITLCKNCINSQTEIKRVLRVSDYVDKYILNKDTEANFDDDDLPEGKVFEESAYTEDWDFKSQAYRISVRFTCEDCGIRLNENYGDGFFLETHHNDGNKANNENYNLRALCTLCHSNIDSNHKKNYSKGANKIKLDKFIELYREKLIKVGNRHLITLVI